MQCCSKDSISKSSNPGNKSDKEPHHICPTKLSKRELEDLYYTLLQNNLELKKDLNEQTDKIKVLSTRLKRMSSIQRLHHNKDARDGCNSTKAHIEEQNRAIEDLTKVNEQLQEHIKQLNMKLCSTKAFLRRTSGQSHYRGSRPNSSISKPGNPSSRKSDDVTSSKTNTMLNQSCERYTETVVKQREESPCEACDQNKCKTQMEEMKIKLADLQEELIKTHDEYSERISKLEVEVNELHEKNEKARFETALKMTSLNQKEKETEEIKKKLRSVESHCGLLESQLSIEQGKVAELETQVKAARMTADMLRDLEERFHSVKTAIAPVLEEDENTDSDTQCTSDDEAKVKRDIGKQESVKKNKTTIKKEETNSKRDKSCSGQKNSSKNFDPNLKESCSEDDAEDNMMLDYETKDHRYSEENPDNEHHIRRKTSIEKHHVKRQKHSSVTEIEESSSEIIHESSSVKIDERKRTNKLDDNPDTNAQRTYFDKLTKKTEHQDDTEESEEDYNCPYSNAACRSSYVRSEKHTDSIESRDFPQTSSKADSDKSRKESRDIRIPVTVNTSVKTHKSPSKELNQNEEISRTPVENARKVGEYNDGRYNHDKRKVPIERHSEDITVSHKKITLRTSVGEYSDDTENRDINLNESPKTSALQTPSPKNSPRQTLSPQTSPKRASNLKTSARHTLSPKTSAHKTPAVIETNASNESSDANARKNFVGMRNNGKNIGDYPVTNAKRAPNKTRKEKKDIYESSTSNEEKTGNSKNNITVPDPIEELAKGKQIGELSERNTRSASITEYSIDTDHISNVTKLNESPKTSSRRTTNDRIKNKESDDDAFVCKHGPSAGERNERKDLGDYPVTKMQNVSNKIRNEDNESFEPLAKSAEKLGTELNETELKRTSYERNNGEQTDCVINSAASADRRKSVFEGNEPRKNVKELKESYETKARRLSNADPLKEYKEPYVSECKRFSVINRSDELRASTNVFHPNDSGYAEASPSHVSEDGGPVYQALVKLNQELVRKIDDLQSQLNKFRLSMVSNAITSSEDPAKIFEMVGQSARGETANFESANQSPLTCENTCISENKTCEIECKKDAGDKQAAKDDGGKKVVKRSDTDPRYQIPGPIPVSSPKSTTFKERQNEESELSITKSSTQNQQDESALSLTKSFQAIRDSIVLAKEYIDEEPKNPNESDEDKEQYLQLSRRSTACGKIDDDVKIASENFRAGHETPPSRRPILPAAPFARECPSSSKISDDRLRRKSLKDAQEVQSAKGETLAKEMLNSLKGIKSSAVDSQTGVDVASVPDETRDPRLFAPTSPPPQLAPLVPSAPPVHLAPPIHPLTISASATPQDNSNSERHKRSSVDSATASDPQNVIRLKESRDVTGLKESGVGTTVDVSVMPTQQQTKVIATDNEVLLDTGYPDYHDSCVIVSNKKRTNLSSNDVASSDGGIRPDEIKKIIEREAGADETTACLDCRGVNKSDVTDVRKEQKNLKLASDDQQKEVADEMREETNRMTGGDLLREDISNSINETQRRTDKASLCLPTTDSDLSSIAARPTNQTLSSLATSWPFAGTSSKNQSANSPTPFSGLTDGSRLCPLATSSPNKATDSNDANYSANQDKISSVATSSRDHAKNPTPKMTEITNWAEQAKNSRLQENKISDLAAEVQIESAGPLQTTVDQRNVEMFSEEACDIHTHICSCPDPAQQRVAPTFDTSYTMRFHKVDVGFRRCTCPKRETRTCATQVERRSHDRNQDFYRETDGSQSNRTYRVCHPQLVKCDRYTSPDNTDKEISSLSDLPTENSDKNLSPRCTRCYSPGEEKYFNNILATPLSPGEEQDRYNTTYSTSYTAPGTCELSEGEITEPTSCNESKSPFKSTNGKRAPIESPSSKVEATLAAITEELARCRILLMKSRAQENPIKLGETTSAYVGPVKAENIAENDNSPPTLERREIKDSVLSFINEKKTPLKIEPLEEMSLGLPKPKVEDSGGGTPLNEQDNVIALKRAEATARIGDISTPRVIFTLHIGTVVLSDEAVINSRELSLVLTWQFYEQSVAWCRLRPGRVIPFDFSTQYDLKLTTEFLDYLKSEDLPIKLCEENNLDVPFASCLLPLREALLHTNRRADMSLALVAGPLMTKKSRDDLDPRDELGVLDVWCKLSADHGLLPTIDKAIAQSKRLSSQRLSLVPSVVVPLNENEKDEVRISADLEPPPAHVDRSPHSTFDRGVQKLPENQTRRDKGKVNNHGYRNSSNFPVYEPQADNLSRKYSITSVELTKSIPSSALTLDLPPKSSIFDRKWADIESRRRSSGIIINEVPTRIKTAQELKQAIENVPKLSVGKQRPNSAGPVGPLSISSNDSRRKADKVSEASSLAQSAEDYLNNTRPDSSIIKQTDSAASAATTTQSEEGKKTFDASRRVTIKRDETISLIPSTLEEYTKPLEYLRRVRNHSIDITILWLALNEECSAMCDPTVQRLYVAYTFLGRGGAELETPMSLPKPKQSQDKCHFNFMKSFPLTDSDLTFLGRLAKCRSPGDRKKVTHNPNECVVFTVVSEPLEDPLGINNCEDIGNAHLYLGDLLAYSAGSDNYTEVIPVRATIADDIIGVLAIKFDGLDVVRKCLMLYSTADEATGALLFR